MPVFFVHTISSRALFYYFHNLRFSASKPIAFTNKLVLLFFALGLVALGAKIGNRYFLYEDVSMFFRQFWISPSACPRTCMAFSPFSVSSYTLFLCSCMPFIKPLLSME